MAVNTISFGELAFSDFAIYKCKGCGERISPKFAFELQPRQAGVEWRNLDGIYCGDCYSMITTSFSSNQGRSDPCDLTMGVCGLINSCLQCCMSLMP